MKFLKGSLKELKKHWQLWVMAAPAILALIIFNYIPMIGLVMAFQDLDYSKGIFSSPFIGLKNFGFLFASTDAWIITRNTILYNVVFIVLNLILSILLALIINELTSKWFSKIVQTIFIMPHFLSMVVVAMVVYAFLSPSSGFVNGLLESFGMEKVYWYTVKGPWPFLIVFIYLWKHIGYSSIIYTAVISGISDEYYEAAALDGATRVQQARYITIPHLKTIVCINLIRSVGGIFYADFGLFYSVPMDNGALYSVTDVLDTYIYRGLTTLGNYGMTTAAGFYQSIVGFCLVLIANAVVTKIDAESAMF